MGRRSSSMPAGEGRRLSASPFRCEHTSLYLTQQWREHCLHRCQRTRCSVWIANVGRRQNNNTLLTAVLVVLVKNAFCLLCTSTTENRLAISSFPEQRKGQRTLKIMLYTAERVDLSSSQMFQVGCQKAARLRRAAGEK